MESDLTIGINDLECLAIPVNAKLSGEARCVHRASA